MARPPLPVTEQPSWRDTPGARLVRAVYSRANCLHPEAFFVRLDARCNQKCGFCNILGPGVSFHLETPYVRAMLRHIARLRSEATVNFTGGEPTLRDDLPELVAYAKRAGIERVVLQTNAIRFARGPLLDALLDAGLDDVLASFHSHRPDVSDELTGAPGTWHKTVEGIRRATARGLKVTINVVLTTRNLDHVAETIDYAATELGGIDGVILSPLQPHGELLRHLDLLPRYEDLVEPVRAAIARVEAHGLELYLSYCENPLCWLLQVFEVKPSAELRRYIARRLRTNGCGECHLSTLMDKDKLKTARCEGCAMDDVCYGLWRAYHRLFGDSELRPAPPQPGTRPLRRPFSVAPHVARGEVALRHTTLGRRLLGAQRR